MLNCLLGHLGFRFLELRKGIMMELLNHWGVFKHCLKLWEVLLHMFSLHSFAHGCAWLFWLGSIVHWTRSRGINYGIIMWIFFPLRERTYIFRHNKIHHKSSVCSKTYYFPAHNNISITDLIPSRGPWTTSWTRSMDHHGPPHGPGPWTTPNFQKEIAPVNMKICRRSGYEKHRLVFFHQYTLITNLFS